MSYTSIVSGIYWLKRRFRFARHLLPARLRKKVLSDLSIAAIARLPSRLYLHTDIIPALAATGARRMLFVGCQPYNQPAYDTCAALGISVWSIDFDPAAAPHGAPQGHFTGDVRAIRRLAPDLVFDSILFNGIIGFGINGSAAAREVMHAFADVATAHCLLVAGWNPGITDGGEILAFRTGLESVALGAVPAVKEFPPAPPVQPTPHRYECFRLAGRRA